MLRPSTAPASSRRASRAAAAARVAGAGPVVVTRSVHFNAAHRLHNPARSARWNRDTFGPCNHPNWHGHNYELEVSVVGVPDPETGYVIDLGVLNAVLQREIVERCDHRNLNLDVDFLRGVIPSAENLAIAFWQRIENNLPHGRLFRMRVRETDRNCADYYGPGGPPRG
jgi:6-pyruvoyltetrahydropterin/6-carboxytetrahydropterin synthase